MIVLVPKLCLGTDVLKTLFRRVAFRERSKSADLLSWSGDTDDVGDVVGSDSKQSFEDMRSQTEFGNEEKASRVYRRPRRGFLTCGETVGWPLSSAMRSRSFAARSNSSASAAASISRCNSSMNSCVT